MGDDVTTGHDVIHVYFFFAGAGIGMFTLLFAISVLFTLLDTYAEKLAPKEDKPKPDRCPACGCYAGYHGDTCPKRKKQ